VGETPGTSPKVSAPVDVPGVLLNDETQTPSERWDAGVHDLSATGPISLAMNELFGGSRTAEHIPHLSSTRADADDVTATPEAFSPLRGSRYVPTSGHCIRLSSNQSECATDPQDGPVGNALGPGERDVIREDGLPGV
jgi:hypothetical protein